MLILGKSLQPLACPHTKRIETLRPLLSMLPSVLDVLMRQGARASMEVLCCSWRQFTPLTQESLQLQGRTSPSESVPAAMICTSMTYRRYRIIRLTIVTAAGVKALFSAVRSATSICVSNAIQAILVFQVLRSCRSPCHYCLVDLQLLVKNVPSGTHALLACLLALQLSVQGNAHSIP